MSLHDVIAKMDRASNSGVMIYADEVARWANELRAALAGGGDPIAWGVAGDGLSKPFLYVEYSEDSARRASVHALNGRVVPLFTHPAGAGQVTDEMISRACDAAVEHECRVFVPEDVMRAALGAALKDTCR